MSWIDEFNNAALQQVQGGANHVYAPPQNAPKSKKKGGRGGTLTSLISEGGAIGGGALGASIGTGILPGIGTLLGGALGAGIGAFGGRVAENEVRDGRLGLADAAKEGALSTAFGIGPIRLAKGAVTATKAATGGASLADALIAGAKGADAPGKLASKLKGKVANVTTGIRDDAALKNFKLNDSTWISKFQSKVGEDPGAFASRIGFATATPKEVATKFYNPLQDTYTSYLKQVPAITKQDIEQALASRINKYAKSDVAEVRAMGQKLKKASGDLLKRTPDEISAVDARAKKAAFQAAVDEKLTDTAAKLSNNTNKQISDVFRTLINDKADAAGIKIDPSTLPIPGSKATTLRELGNELRGIKEFSDKAAVKQNVGRGKNPLGLTSSIGAIGGASLLSNPVGLVAGGAVPMLVNSQAGRRAEYSLAKKLSEKGGMNVGPLQKGARIGAQGALGAALLGADQSSPLEPSMSDSTQSATNANTMPMNANMGVLSQGINNLSTDSNSPFAPQNLESAIQKIISNGGTLDDAAKFVNLAGTMQKLTAQGGQKLNSTQMQQANNAQSGLDSLATIQQTLSSNPNAAKLSALPGGSFTQSLTGTGSYSAALANATDVIGRLRSGGAINADEEKRFRSLLPASFDNPDTIGYKLNALSSLFNRFVNPGSASPDTTDLASALLAAQGGR